MEIKCTVEEFGQIVRGCQEGACYACALTKLCGFDQSNRDRTGKIERFIVEVTPPPAKEEPQE